MMQTSDSNHQHSDLKSDALTIRTALGERGNKHLLRWVSNLPILDIQVQIVNILVMFLKSFTHVASAVKI